MITRVFGLLRTCNAYKFDFFFIEWRHHARVNWACDYFSNKFECSLFSVVWKGTNHCSFGCSHRAYRVSTVLLRAQHSGYTTLKLWVIKVETWPENPANRIKARHDCTLSPQWPNFWESWLFCARKNAESFMKSASPRDNKESDLKWPKKRAECCVTGRCLYDRSSFNRHLDFW